MEDQLHPVTLLGMVLVANAMSAGFAWGCWQIIKSERDHKTPWKADGMTWIAVGLPMAAVFFGALLI